MDKQETHRQKQREKPRGRSRYALKVIRRKRAALALGLPANTPWPVIWAFTPSIRQVATPPPRPLIETATMANPRGD